MKPNYILKKPYPLYIDFSKNFPYLLAVSIFLPLFLIIFQPFGLSASHDPNKNLILIGFGLVCFIVLSINLNSIPKMFPKVFNEDSWNIGREVLWNLWLGLTVIWGLAIYLSVASGVRITIPYLANFTINGLLVIIVFLPACIMLNYIRIIKTKLRKAEEISQKLEFSYTLSGSQSLELTSENKKEKLKLTVNSLLFIQSCDNYANIVLQNNGKIKETLLRSSLKNIEKQLAVPFIVRCHRSFIVNLSHVRSVVGNARNYTLHLKNYGEPIPVSRDSEKKVLEILENHNH